MNAATQFLAAWPEATSFHVTILTEDKRPLVNKAAAGIEEITKNLASWLALQRVHFFIRPNLRSSIFVDLDEFKGSWELLWKLKPRLVVQTSAGNYQAWFCSDARQPAQTAAFVTKKLAEILGGDHKSTAPTQQGRMPGSRNCKPGKDFTVNILHQEVQNLCEEEFVKVAPQQKLRVHEGRLEPVPQSLRSKQDRSGVDWHLACQFFEQNPGRYLTKPMLTNVDHCFSFPATQMPFLPYFDTYYYSTYVGIPNIIETKADAMIEQPVTSSCNWHRVNFVVQWQC